MKCLALGLLKEGSQPDWYVPGSVFFGIFNIKDEIHIRKKQLIEICYTLEPNHCDFAFSFGYYLAAFKSSKGCCMVVCDTLLTQTQMFNLASWVFSSSLSLETIAGDIATCTQHEYQIHQLHQVLNETTETLFDSMKILYEREEALGEVLEKAKKLEADSITFVDKTKKMNSCWPSCTLL